MYISCAVVFVIYNYLCNLFVNWNMYDSLRLNYYDSTMFERVKLNLCPPAPKQRVTKHLT